MSYAGHSLGGGFAAASTYATGNESTTCNAAGVSQKTFDNNGIDQIKGGMNDLIKAYTMTTDPLNFLQNY